MTAPDCCCEICGGCHCAQAPQYVQEIWNGAEFTVTRESQIEG